MPFVVEKEGVTASASEKRDVAGPCDVGRGSKRHVDAGEDLFPDGLGRSRASSPVAMKTSTVCLPSCGVENT